MTYEPTVVDQNNVPVSDVLVTVNNEINGESFSRSTDGNGYANVALLGTTQPTDRLTISVLDPQMRFKGKVLGDTSTAQEANGKFTVQLDPFV